MERLDYQNAEEEANNIRELAGENPTFKAYELSDRLNEERRQINLNQHKNLGEQDIDVRLSELKKKIEEGGIPEVPELTKKLPSTLKEILSAFAPEGSTGTKDALYEAGEKAFIRWFLDTEGLPFLYKIKIKKRMRSEDEIIGILLANGLVKDTENAKAFIKSLTSTDRSRYELRLEREKNKTGDWVYRLIKPSTPFDDDL